MSSPISRMFRPSICILLGCNSITLCVRLENKRRKDIRVRTGAELASRNSSQLPHDQQSPPSRRVWYRNHPSSNLVELSRARTPVGHWESQEGLGGSSMYTSTRSTAFISERTGIPFKLLSQGKCAWGKIDFQNSQNICVIARVYQDP